MRTEAIRTEDLRGVFPVPPLARKQGPGRPLDLEQNDRIVRHIAGGGITRLIYGGNAFLYHINMADYEQMLDWLSGLDDSLWCIPSIGPGFGRAMEQAALLSKYRFPMAMMLPSGDPRDAAGIAVGVAEVAQAAGIPLMAYVKDENNLGGDKERGLDALAGLIDRGICRAIKYAVVRENPAQDAYLTSLLRRIDRKYVISGIGERPAVAHTRDFQLPGFTTGSGCVAPALSQLLFELCSRKSWAEAESVRGLFLPLEDLRDAYGPARVLHHAVELAGIAAAGPILPLLSACNEEQLSRVAPAAQALCAARAPMAYASRR